MTPGGAWVVATSVLAFACLGFSGCKGKGSGSVSDYDTLDALGAGCPSSKAANLTLAGDPIPVTVGCTDKAGVIEVKLTAHNAVFEIERYRRNGQNFELLDAAGEIYDPPVIIAKAPMRVGDKWEWTGNMKAGDVAHPAKATISTSTDQIWIPNSPAVDAVKITVDFSIDGGGPTPAKRNLSFWLAPKVGVVKRTFGSSSQREPAGP